MNFSAGAMVHDVPSLGVTVYLGRLEGAGTVGLMGVLDRRVGLVVSPAYAR
jgi:hypothetical protein